MVSIPRFSTRPSCIHVESNLPLDQECHLEENLRYLAFDIFVCQPKVGVGDVDVSVAQLLLKRVQPPSAVNGPNGLGSDEREHS